MKLLEVFSGTKSLGKVAEELGWTVVSLDISDEFSPTIVADILEWDYTVFSPGEFHYVHASPPCEIFSIAHSHGKRDFIKGDAIAKRTLEIIDYLKPRFYSIENPYKSLIWQREFKDLGCTTVDYCCYSLWGFRKRTKLATNIDFNPRVCRGDCQNMRGTRHRTTAQQGTHGRYEKQTKKSVDLYRIPPALCKELLENTFQSQW